jgi:hypothetical protein
VPQLLLVLVLLLLILLPVLLLLLILLLLLPGISKALESSYTRVLAQKLKGDGIMVNACCPG